jgi:hypothetical protein
VVVIQRACRGLARAVDLGRPAHAARDSSAGPHHER